MAKLKITKWFILLLLLCIFVFAGRSLETRTLSETAIVIGMAIDYVDGEYLISVQTVISSGSSETSADTYAISYAKSTMTSNALTKIGEELGQIMTLAHCNLVIISTKALAQNPLDVLEGFEKSWYLPLHAIIVACEQNAKDVLSAPTPSSEASSFHITLALFQNKNVGFISSVTVKDFFVGAYCKSQTVTLPIIAREPLSEEDVLDKTTDQQYYSFHFTNNLAISTNGKQYTLTPDETTGYNFIIPVPTRSGASFTINTPNYDMVFLLVEEQCRQQYKNDKLISNVKLKLTIGEYCNKTDGANQANSINTIPDEIKKEAKTLISQQLSKKISATYEACKKSNIDFVHAKNKAYQKKGRKWICPDNFLQTLEYEINIELSLKDS